MKARTWIFGIGLILFFGLFIGNVHAATILDTTWNYSPYNEKNLRDIYESLYGTVYTNAQLSALEATVPGGGDMFHTVGGSSTVQLVAQYTGSSLSFGYYTGLGSGSGKTNLLNVPSSINAMYPAGVLGPYNGTINTSVWFGTYIGNAYKYSEASLNPEGKDYLVVLPTNEPNKWLLAFEDGTDNDYQDLVIELRNAYPVVPEPASMSLLGMGLLGAIGAGFRRRKR